MGTVTIKNLSTLTDAAAILRVAAMMGELETLKETSKFEVNIKMRRGHTKAGDKITEYTVTDTEEKQ